MLALAIAFYISLVTALGQKKTVAFDKESGTIDLFSKGKSAQLTVDGNGMYLTPSHKFTLSTMTLSLCGGG